MKWFEQNRWLGSFLIVLAAAILAALFFLFHARGRANLASARFQESVMEKNRLERLDPFPSEANYRIMKLHLENYGTALDKLKQELKKRVLPAPPLAPNEFQSHLRQAMLAVSEKARANQVKLPENFALGFDEFTNALPNTEAAPALGQELSQIELLTNILIDARVDSITALTRVPVSPEATPGPTPLNGGRSSKMVAPASQFVERTAVMVSFTAAPSAARKVLNQVATSNQQFFIVRLLQVRDEQEKGPPREHAAATPTPATAAVAEKIAPNTALKFIVGTEHIQASARIELVRFTF
jgi:hypothetical protein